MEPDWFATHAVSIYDTYHSMDIQQLPLASRSFGAVICNHVLEHVPEDRKGMAELFRIAHDDGFVQISVPDPARMKETNDWGTPDWSDHGHYRKYGIDILDKLVPLAEEAEGVLLTVPVTDPVTGMEDLFFLFTRNRRLARMLLDFTPGVQVRAGELEIAEDRPAPSDLPPLLHPEHLLAVPEGFRRYVVDAGHATVPGWVTPGALSALTALSGVQRRLGVQGHVCAVGVSRERFFLAMALLRRLGEKGLAVEDPDNPDAASLQGFEGQVKRWLGPDADVSLWRTEDGEVSPGEVIARLGGRVRLFSIEGAHGPERILAGLRLAEECAAEGGLVVLNDFLHPHWPGVVETVIRYLSDGGRLEPVGYGDNKLYFATPGYGARYCKGLVESLGSLFRDRKAVTFCGHDILYFALPEPKRLLAETGLTPGKPGRFEGCELSGPMGGASAREDGLHVLGRFAGLALRLPERPVVGDACLSVDLECVRGEADAEPVLDLYLGDRHAGRAVFPDGTDRQTVALNLPLADLGPARRLELWVRNEAASPDARGEKGGASFRMAGVSLVIAAALASETAA